MTERLCNVPLILYVNRAELDMTTEKMKRLDTDNKSTYLRKMAVDGYAIKIDERCEIDTPHH